MVRGQAMRAHLVGEAVATEVLHRPRLRRIGLGVERGAGLGIDQQAADAAAAEFVGEHQPARSAAGDEDVDVDAVVVHLSAIHVPMAQVTAARCR